LVQGQLFSGSLSSEKFSKRKSGGCTIHRREVFPLFLFENFSEAAAKGGS